MTRRIKKVAVLGSGVMGSGIACHFANIGAEVLLIDIVPRELDEKEKAKGLTLEDKEVRNRIVNNSIGFYNESILKLKPGDADDFTKLSAARDAIITLYRGVQGMVAAGESAAKELEEAKDNLSHRGLL